MKFSAIATLCAAPLAMAGMLHADVIPRGLQGRTDHKGESKAIEVGGNAAVHIVSTTTIIIIWVNNGGGAPTSTVSPTQGAPAATHTVSTMNEAWEAILTIR